MDIITIKAKAKVNLALDVLGKRTDGYHEMRMINHRVDFADFLELRIKDSGIFLLTDSDEIPSDERNLVVIAARKIFDYCQIKKGVEIRLRKQIPHEAGLAGGSADAAATLLGLNELLNLNLSMETLSEIGVSVGADVPYCLYNETALVEGIGEKITPLESIGSWPVILIKPDISIKTVWAFQKLTDIKKLNHPQIDEIMGYLSEKKYWEAISMAGNVFEEPIFSEYPELREIKEELTQNGAVAAVMTGSGSTMIGYFRDESKAKIVFDKLKTKYKRIFYTKTC